MNYNGSDYEETVDLKDLCLYILKKWRIILLTLIAGAVLLGAWRFVSTYSSEKEITVEDDEELTEAILENEESLNEIQDLLDENEENLEANHLALTKNAEAQNANVRSQSTNELDITAAKETLESRQNSLSDMKQLKENYESNLALMNDILGQLTSISEQASMIADINELNSAIQELNLQIAAYEEDVFSYEKKVMTLEETAEDLLKTGADLADAAQDLALEQEELKAEHEELLAVQEELLLAAAELHELQDEYPITVSGFSSGSVVRYAMLGAVLGVFLVCCAAFIQYFFNGTLRGAEEFRDRYGVEVLGSLYQPPVRTNRVDRWLDRLSGYGYTVDPDREYSLIAARIQVMEDARPVKIIVTGTLSMDQLESVQDHVRALLPEDEYQVEAMPNPVYQAESVLSIKGSTLLLAEAVGVSEKSELNKLADLLVSAKASVIGSVLL